MTAIIYSLSDPRTGAVRYVGKTGDRITRMREHLRGIGKTPKAKWIRKLRKLGLTPIFEVIEEVPLRDWQEAEVFWIAQMRAWGFGLLNADNGGLGSDRLPESVRRKISLALAGKPNEALARPVAQLDLSGKLLRLFSSYQEAAKSAGVYHSNICRAIRFNRTCGGFKWARPA